MSVTEQRQCANCGKGFRWRPPKRPGSKTTTNGVFCSRRCVNSVRSECRKCGDSIVGCNTQWCSKCRPPYTRMGEFERKAWSLSANLSFFPGDKRQFMEGRLREAVGKPCRYCGLEIELDKASLDHMTPFGGREQRSSKEAKRKLNVPENLQIICRKCNGAKSDFTHEQFQALLEACSDHVARARLLQRLNRANYPFRRKAA